ncbi:MAG: hypothetical protein GF364_08920, partial [Candidatus Lokiarchaeota archaeon]|nr:hypothetical protein [Candidatus Lokiarchaeota archaeon]
MKKFYSIEFLSDTIIGSSSTLGKEIDNDVCYDDCGLPYIPSKRLKGLFKRNARELILLNAIHPTILDLFGRSGRSDPDLVISNAYIFKIRDKHNLRKIGEYREVRRILRVFQESNIITKPNIIDYFTYIRAQTAIDEDGITKDKSLRFSRVIKKGLLFKFSIEISNSFSISKNLIDDFNKTLEFTKNIGLMRTRGFGEIKIKPIEINDDNTKNDSKDLKNKQKYQNEDYIYLKIKLENLEPIIVRNAIGDINRSENFIRGSYIRAAIASIYQKMYGNDEENYLKFKKLFIDSNIFFTNLYPSLLGDIAYPTPNTIKKEKYGNKYYDLSNQQSRKEILETSPQLTKFSEFLLLKRTLKRDRLGLIPVSVDKGIESHHLQPKSILLSHPIKSGTENNKFDTGTFFHYESIKARHNFTGYIHGTYQNLKEIIEILRDPLEIQIGKSRTAQYGKCLIWTEKLDSLLKKQDLQPNMMNKKRLVITLLSDTILRNHEQFTGGRGAELLLECIKKDLKTFNDLNKNSRKNIKVWIEKNDNYSYAFISYVTVGGFNGLSLLPKAQNLAIKAGSVIIIESDKDLTEFTKFLHLRHIGLRKSEGYGQIACNM